MIVLFRLRGGRTMATSRNYAERMAASITITNRENVLTEKCTRQNCMCTRLLHVCKYLSSDCTCTMYRVSVHVWSSTLQSEVTG